MTIGNAAARHGSTVMWAPSANLRMWSWHVAVPSSGPCGRPLIIIEHDAADALAAVVVERDRLAALLDQALVEHVEELEERHVGADVVDLVGLERARSPWARPGARP